MNTIWSTYIQKTGTLYLTRSLRFADLFKDVYINAFDINHKKSILEIGCGPGALTQALHRWYPEAEVTGIDRDSEFVAFASKQAANLNFLEADATALPFEADSFDVTISNTVQEHIEPSKFFGEQYRVLRPGGVCLVLSARRGINQSASCVQQLTALEKEIDDRANQYFNEANQKYNVCAYPLSEAELPLTMEKYGFRNVSTSYLTINLTPDHPGYSKDMAYAMINANRQVALDGIDSLPLIAPGIATAAEIKALKKAQNDKFDKRLELFDKGEKQWDTNVAFTMVVRGTK